MHTMVSVLTRLQTVEILTMKLSLPLKRLSSVMFAFLIKSENIFEEIKPKLLFRMSAQHKKLYGKKVNVYMSICLYRGALYVYCHGCLQKFIKVVYKMYQVYLQSLPHKVT